MKLQQLSSCVFIFLFFFAVTCKNQPKMEVEKKAMSQKSIRKSAVAGSWYSSNPDELRDEISQYLENAKLASIDGEIFALISPHAGYAYSGFTAANSYKQIMGNKYDAVIVIAPSHREMFYGVSVFDGDGYETPLGVVPVEKTIAKAIVNNNDKIRFSTDGHHDEHSLEIQLPFLQMAVPDLKIVPIVFWDHSWQNCQLLANAITKAVKGKKVLVVASSDLYHGNSYKDCNNTDNNTLKQVTELEPEKLCQGFERQHFMACGAGGIVVAEIVAMNLGANKAKIIYQTNSNDVTGSKGGYVVGYGAVAIYQEKKSGDEKKVGIDSDLSQAEKKALLTIARQTIKLALEGKALPEPQYKFPLFQEKRGAFVTLHKNKMLRGCIGYIFAYKPLEETIIEMAQAAAFRDPRFPPLEKNELNELEIEISVLTPIREITDINEIEVGKHGIIIERGMNSGLLLPQVATEYGWDRETFLDHTCQKAGLPKNTWKKEGTVIKIFSADVFHEE